MTGSPPAELAVLTRRITILSVGTASLLVLVKGAAWIASGSLALLASLADSGLDLAASLITFFAVRHAASPPDAEHRFGHGKAEAFAGLVQGGLVLASAVLVGREAIDGLLHPRPVRHEAWGVAVMIVSIVLTLALMRAQAAVMARTRSVAIAGDHAHYAADLASNFVTLASLALIALLGWVWVDAAASLGVAAWLLWGAVGVFRQAADQLMDHELPGEDREAILALLADDTRIGGVHQLRTRAAGPHIHIQAHMDLAGNQTLAEAHAIMVAAEDRVRAAFPSADVLLHPDPRG